MPQLSSTLFLARVRTFGAVSSLALLGACATLPASGPTAGEIRKGARNNNQIGFRMVDIDSPLVDRVETAAAAADAAQPTLASLATVGRNDVVGPGDVLTVGIYEVGVSLFGGAHDLTLGGGAGAIDTSARGEPFPAVVVDSEGAIRLPYIGRLEVAGHTPAEIQAMINRGLRGKSQNPQSLVVVRNNVSNTVYVTGDVRKPGRFELTLQRERLLDAIALGGGAEYSSEDTIVRVTRGERTLEERLGRIRASAADNLQLVPGDRIELIKRPRSFIVLGATSKVSQVPFETGDVSLAEAVARSGGPVDAVADPAAVFLFRYDPALPGAKDVPTIYRLNMLQPASYFLAQRFAIRDKDVIYVASAAANRPAKLVGIINQLFSPFVTARAISR